MARTPKVLRKWRRKANPALRNSLLGYFTGSPPRLILDAVQWARLQDILTASPRPMPRLAALFARPDFFDHGLIDDAEVRMDPGGASRAGSLDAESGGQ